MNLFPRETETIVLVHTREDTLVRVALELSDDLIPGTTRRLTGWVEGDKFQLTIRLRRHHMFMPVINGVVEETSKGSIVFLTYTLFPSTRMLLLFWTIILPLIGILITIQQGQLAVAGGAVAVAFIFLAVAWSNFKLHMKSTRALMYQVLQA